MRRTFLVQGGAQEPQQWRGAAGRSGLQVFLPGQVLQRFVEQIIVTPSSLVTETGAHSANCELGKCLRLPSSAEWWTFLVGIRDRYFCPLECLRICSSTAWWTFLLCLRVSYPQCKLCRNRGVSTCVVLWQRGGMPVVVQRHVPMVLQTVQMQFSGKDADVPCCATSCPHGPDGVENCGWPAVALH